MSINTHNAIDTLIQSIQKNSGYTLTEENLYEVRSAILTFSLMVLVDGNLRTHVLELAEKKYPKEVMDKIKGDIMRA